MEDSGTFVILLFSLLKSWGLENLLFCEKIMFIVNNVVINNTDRVIVFFIVNLILPKDNQKMDVVKENIVNETLWFVSAIFSF